ncbi:MAG: nuclear transport factor 2 family protein [Candidatus Kapabacteria bacterium]|nr:nuclear transport factor 2 family protein [Ignavibacteriota bacterium]MCW5884915.1 nuclear transport factor 2 family protein [Candidatus Kapabacteria bacterium]
MLKLLVMFGTLLAFIYVLSGIEQSEIKRSEPHSTVQERKIDDKLAEPVKMQLEAYNNRSISEFVNCFSDDIKLFRLQTGELFCDGRDNLIAIYGDLFNLSENLHCEVVSRITCGDFVIDEEHVAGLVEGEIVHATAIYEVQNGKIIKAWFIRGK